MQAGKQILPVCHIPLYPSISLYIPFFPILDQRWLNGLRRNHFGHPLFKRTIVGADVALIAERDKSALGIKQGKSRITLDANLPN